ncbi:hypothetical protein CDAR_406311 [Caerostris darwini]|uniref:Uncharacterized protein n=1 Tax=Caerostris darwini TaxID=1538125 RepID=A0AAV4MTD2_9ARAC|nr:hypothetical protein CDAR_406311 [Caerostris darwini]
MPLVKRGHAFLAVMSDGRMEWRQLRSARIDRWRPHASILSFHPPVPTTFWKGGWGKGAIERSLSTPPHSCITKKQHSFRTLQTPVGRSRKFTGKHVFATLDMHWDKSYRDICKKEIKHDL